MRTRSLAVALVAAALAAAGCGSGSSGGTTAPAANPESGTQAQGGFPGAGSPTAPDVTTTPGQLSEKSKGKAGGGSSATCIGC